MAVAVPPAAAGAPAPVAAARECSLAPPGTLEQVGGHAARVLGDRVAGFGRGRSRRLDLGGRLGRCIAFGRRGLGAPAFLAGGQSELLAPLGAALQEMFGDLGHRLVLPYSGPETPPSLRTRQKCTAMKMTITKGNNSTWSVYQRSSVSPLISLEPSSAYRI